MSPDGRTEFNCPFKLGGGGSDFIVEIKAMEHSGCYVYKSSTLLAG